MLKVSDDVAPKGGGRTPPLQRRHTIEIQSPSDRKDSDNCRPISRTLSNDSCCLSGKELDNANRESCEERPNSESKEDVSSKSLPKVAWSGVNNSEIEVEGSPGHEVQHSAPHEVEGSAALEIEGSQALLKCLKRRNQIRPKSCVTPLPSSIKKREEQKETNKSQQINESKVQTLKADSVQITPPPEHEEPKDEKTNKSKKVLNSNEILDRIAAKVSRSQSTPDIYGNIQKKKVRSASLDEPDSISSTVSNFEPYDGLLIQKAQFFTQEYKREHHQSLSFEDEDDEGGDYTKSAKLLGYRPRNGFNFLPFNKLFTKPKSATSRHTSRSSSARSRHPSRSSSARSRHPSRSSIEDTLLEVENTLHQFSESEKEVIKKTRSALKQRISSANKRRLSSASRKKIQLNIVVSAKPESDDSGPCSDHDEPNAVHRPKSTPSTDLSKKKYKVRKVRNRERSVPAELLKSRLEGQASKKSTKNKSERKSTKIVRKVKKKEIPTMMSEISPVPSDFEYDFEKYHEHRQMLEDHEVSGARRNFKYHQQYGDSSDDEGGQYSTARGGFLQTIISEASAYTPVTKTWKGNRMHVEVRIKTHDQDSSSDEVEEGDHKQRVEEERKNFREWKRNRLSRQDRVEGPSSSASPAEVKTIGGRAPGGLLLPFPRRSAARSSSLAPTPAALRAKEREKMRQILEVCSAKVEESKTIMRRLGSSGVWVSLDTLQRGLMSPTEYRVYQDHLKALEEKQQKKHPPPLRRSSPSPFRG